jgi:predicted ArsR family transcriptional regulator
MNTREEIIRYLQLHPYSCADELGTVLGKTRANIQHHLKIMERANLITQVSINQSKPLRGRPRAYFSLTPIKRSNNFLSLIDALLQLFLEKEDNGAVTPILEKIAQQIIHPVASTSTLTQRLNRTVKELSNSGYQARWEAHADGPQVVFRNCPYHPLPDKYPALCRMDALILMKNLAVSEPVQIAKIQIPVKPSCRFVIKEN